MSYEVVGIRPGGALGLRLTCDTKERAEVFADMWRLLHPDWKITVRASTGSSPMAPG